LDRDFVIRPYEFGDEEGIVELLEHSPGGWPGFDLSCTPVEHWRWKYQLGPIENDYITVCSKDEKIVGCIHIIPQRIKIGDEIVLGNIGADLAVHPDFRGLGLSKKMREFHRSREYKNEHQLTYFVTSNPIMIKEYSKKATPFPHPVANFVRIRDVDLQLQKMPVRNPRTMKLGYEALKILNGIGRLFHGRRRPKSSMDISPVKSFDGRVDGLWDRLSPHYKFMVERKRDYLNWRYCHPHAGNFVVRQAETNGGVAGYSVLLINRNNRDYPVGYIVDLIFEPSKIDVAGELVSNAIEYFDGQGVNIINTFVIRKNLYEKILNENGLINSRMNLNLFLGVNTKRKQLTMLREAHVNSMHFSYGDIDSLPSGLPERNM
jgi:predicted N-acetyltransferase YhbS